MSTLMPVPLRRPADIRWSLSQMHETVSFLINFCGGPKAFLYVA